VSIYENGEGFLSIDFLSKKGTIEGPFGGLDEWFKSTVY